MNVRYFSHAFVNFDFVPIIATNVFIDVVYNSHYWLLYDVSHSDSDSDCANHFR